jgi:hypothetical protein
VLFSACGAGWLCEHGLQDVHAAEPGAPLVERRMAEAAVAAQLLNRHACFGLPKEPDDLSSVNLLFFMFVSSGV